MLYARCRSARWSLILLLTSTPLILAIKASIGFIQAGMGFSVRSLGLGRGVPSLPLEEYFFAFLIPAPVINPNHAGVLLLGGNPLFIYHSFHQCGVFFGALLFELLFHILGQLRP